MRVEWKPLTAGRLDHERIWGMVVTAGALIVAIIPLEALRLSCPFKHFTGWPCPTCGLTRAVVELRRLDVAAAFSANPLIAALAIFAAVYAVYAWTVALFNTPRLRISLTQRWEPHAMRAFVIAAFLANWVYLIAAGR